MVVAEPGGSSDDKGVLAGMELKTVVIVHRSQLVYKVKIVVYNEVGDGGMTWRVEGVA